MNPVRDFKVKTVLEYAVLSLLFFLPWQTVWIFREGTTGVPGTSLENVWQYGTMGVYLWDVIAIVCIALFFLLVTRRHDRDDIMFTIKKNKGSLLFVGVALLFVGISLVWAQNRDIALYYAIRFLQGFLLFVIIQSLQVHWKKMALTLIAAGSIQACLAIGQFFIQEVPASTLLGMAYHSPRVLGDAVVQTVDARWLRAYGSFPHPNILAYFLGIAFLCSATLATRAEKKYEMVWLSVSTILLLIGLFFTFSREVVLCLFIVLGISLLWKKREDRNTLYEGISPTTLLVIMSCIIVATLSGVYREPVFARLGIGGLERLEKKSLQERVSSLEDGWKTIQHAPQGVGVGNSTYALEARDRADGVKKPWYAYQPAHSHYLLIAAEIGVLGLLCFLAFLAHLAWKLLRRASSSIAFVLKQRLFLFAIFVGFFDHFFWTIPVGIVLWWIGMALSGVDNSSDVS
ncbi:O-antigen ligase family protein [Candidatus Uhrbacteria bacterium]|nr:O-antigen ligase family protein [Candidatus Uhrbacteria bacterium]